MKKNNKKKTKWTQIRTKKWVVNDDGDDDNGNDDDDEELEMKIEWMDDDSGWTWEMKENINLPQICWPVSSHDWAKTVHFVTIQTWLECCIDKIR